MPNTVLEAEEIANKQTNKQEMYALGSEKCPNQIYNISAWREKARQGVGVLAVRADGIAGEPH